MLWLGLIFGLNNLLFYKRFFFSNRAYEKRIDRILKLNPNIKLIHRLDGSYQNICKVYGFDKTVKYINNKADLSIHQSKFSVETWAGNIKTIFGSPTILNSKKTITIDNGVDTKIFNKIGKKFHLKGKWRILHVSASLNPNKRFYMVLELAEIFKNNDEIQFYLIGNQINDPLCGNDIKNFENVIYLGFIRDREELSKYYRSCNIFLFPPIRDCSSNVILEAMASGLPVITSDSGSNMDLIIKNTLRGGVVIDEKNPAMSLKIVTENYEKYHNDALNIIKTYHDADITVKKYSQAIFETLQI